MVALANGSLALWQEERTGDIVSSHWDLGNGKEESTFTREGGVGAEGG